jgi:hypothetical protein
VQLLIRENGIFKILKQNRKEKELLNITNKKHKNKMAYLNSDTSVLMLNVNKLIFHLKDYLSEVQNK